MVGKALQASFLVNSSPVWLESHRQGDGGQDFPWYRPDWSPSRAPPP